MSRLRARLVSPLLFVLAASSACSDAEPDSASDPDPTTSTSAALEAITAQGIAGVVRDVVSADLIESYSEAGESDSIGVLVQLAGRQVLVVNVQVGGDVRIDSGEDLAETAMGSADCVVDEDGTITASGTAEPFSDDNSRGSTALAQSVSPESGRVVYALYETYSRQAALDPATNEAGADIEFTAQRN